MNYEIKNWIELALRWTHVFAGIMWVGATYYFTWLDRRFHTTDPEQVWMVHSGGFYVVEKQTQPSPSHTLHWFKWEAALTWLSGVPLLILIYYAGGLLADEGKNFNVAVASGIGAIVLGWIVYDLLWISPLAKIEPLAVAISFGLIVALGWWLPHVMSARAAYMHVGAALGTIMAANVWMRIIPGQRKYIAALREGREPDRMLTDRAKFRSKHNTYIVMPVVLLMMNYHLPVAMRGYDWRLLPVFLIVGWVVAHIIRKQ